MMISLVLENFFKFLLLPVMLILALTTIVDARTTFNNAGNPDAKRLYDDLLSNYNKFVRPVVNSTDQLKVRIKLKLSQLIDVVSSTYHSPKLYCISKVSSHVQTKAVACRSSSPLLAAAAGHVTY